MDPRNKLLSHIQELRHLAEEALNSANLIGQHADRLEKRLQEEDLSEEEIQRLLQTEVLRQEIHQQIPPAEGLM